MTIWNQLEVFLVQYEFKRIDNIYLIYRGKGGLISKIFQCPQKVPNYYPEHYPLGTFQVFLIA